jgi:hypothetical protein
MDRIAQDLTVEVRAAYYRELKHCRSLPENDEMLRIVRAMQFMASERLHPEQKKAVEFVLHSRNRAVAISGSAGTGERPPGGT